MKSNNGNCPACSKELPSVDSLAFCPYCAKQISCKECLASIVADAIVCVKCGTPIESLQQSQSKVMLNEFDFEQKGTSKKVRAKFSNDVGNTFAEALASVIGASNVSKRLANPFLNSGFIKNDQKTLLPKAKNFNEEIQDAEIIDENILQEGLSKIFSFDGEKLSLINPRLKQTGKLDNSIRLAILTLYAFDAAGIPEVERSVISDILGQSKLEDGNFRGWIAKCDEVLHNGNKLKLSVPGKEIAKKILQEVLNDTVQKGAIKFSKTSTKSNKKKRSDSGEIENARVNVSRKKGPIFYLDELIKDGFFVKKRLLGEIIEHLKVNKAENLQPNELSTPLKRMIKSKRLMREKNSDGQYEYYA
jgi:transcription initiation factor TFIIIB Brf1 subunit/transcription initiation factor TFIIB